MRLILTAALALSSIAGAASAQSWTSYGERHARPYGYETGRYYSNPYDHGRRSYSRDRSYDGQADRPGDYRCDAFWDANRTDCGERWRDQRRYSSSWKSGRHGYSSNYGYGYNSYGRGYGSVYPGAYGRPDLVYGGQGAYAAGPRNQSRIDWCRQNYRSYDPTSGYYRAYSGRLVWCG